MNGSAVSPILRHWLALPKTTCCAYGKVSVIMLAREIFMPPQRPSWIDIADVSRDRSGKCSNSQESENTPRTPSPALPSINQSQSSRLTLLAFWRDFSIFVKPSIPSPAEKHSGNMEQRFFQNPAPGLTTPHSSISAHLFAFLESPSVAFAR